MNICTLCSEASLYLICMAVYMYVGHKSLDEFSLTNVINALHKADFADADWEQLGVQLKQRVVNIR